MAKYRNKLCPATQSILRRLYATGAYSLKDLAEPLGVSKETVRLAVKPSARVRHRERSRQWLVANVERRNAYAQTWRDANREHLNARLRERYAKNPLVKSASNRKWNTTAAGLACGRAKAKRWALRHPEKIRQLWEVNGRKRRARKRGAPGPGATAAELCRVWGFMCAYCGTSEGEVHVDHIVPLIRGGTNYPSNLAPVCAFCNMSKGSKLLEEWRPGIARWVKIKAAHCGRAMRIRHASAGEAEA